MKNANEPGKVEKDQTQVLEKENLVRGKPVLSRNPGKSQELDASATAESRRLKRGLVESLYMKQTSRLPPSSCSVSANCLLSLPLETGGVASGEITSERLQTHGR